MIDLSTVCHSVMVDLSTQFNIPYVRMVGSQLQICDRSDKIFVESFPFFSPAFHLGCDPIQHRNILSGDIFIPTKIIVNPSGIYIYVCVYILERFIAEPYFQNSEFIFRIS